MAGVEEVAFAYSNDDGEPYGLSTAAIYADLAKPFAEQSMKTAHVPVRPDGRPHLYDAWQKKSVQKA